MRTKSAPRFLPKRDQSSHAFMYIRKFSRPFDLSDAKSRKRPKNVPDVRLELSRTYDYSLSIHMQTEVPPASFCLQSVSLPFSSSLLIYFTKSHRVDIYFSSSSQVALCFKTGASRERVVINAEFPNLSFILYGLSSTSLILYGRIVGQSLEIDVVVKSTAILTTPDFVQYAISSQQFEKIFSFITLQIWPHDGSLDKLKLPLFSNQIETQEEFLESLNFIYATVQANHLLKSSLWNDASIQQPVEIKVDLLPYQIDAVRWMIYREKNCSSVVDPDWLHSYFVRINEDNLYFSALTGQ